MREIKEKNNWPMYSLLLVLVCICVGILFIQPYINFIKEINTQIGAKEIQQRELEGKLISLKQIQNTFSTNPNIASNLALAMPDSNALAEIIENLNGISNQSAVDLTLIKQNASKSEEQTIIDLSFDSSYTSFKLFLDDLENNLRLATPTKIGIVATKNSVGGETYLKGNMTLDFFKVNLANQVQDNTQGEKTP